MVSVHERDMQKTRLKLHNIRQSPTCIKRSSWFVSGVVPWEILECNQSTNDQLHCQQRQHVADTIAQKKRLELTDVMFLRDNARCAELCLV